ncbi:hypothetical protein AS850_01080 [Frondihabitans sp. 762G35]|uniref:SIMPL domain-containing protein n=1 Tax=Frondihabitans sp. 762G35 TaxID=1446794 RepID=UPI000D2003AD|nr:SIMPL domain-containing protein [Frondihabitans sp. 762G35]ARC55667.1 hypothetical protein AS850_01080 [Frondihabitans sp. 762G35]
MTTFAVAGNATTSHPAERATLRVTVAVTSTDRADAGRAAASAHAAAITEVRAHEAAGAVTEWSAESVSTGILREYTPSGEVAPERFRARAGIDAVFADFERLAEWVGSLSTREGIEIAGLDWGLTPEVSARLEREVRIAAVQDALTKSKDYAAALGLPLPTLEAVFEDGLRPGVGGGGGGGFARDAVALKAAAFDGTVFELRPRPIEVRASISADFRA